MRYFVISSLLVIATSTAAPAGARIAGKHPRPEVPVANPFPEHRPAGPSVGSDVRDIRKRVERARDNGVISRREARQLKREARLIGGLERRYGRDGLSQSERKELEARASYLRDAVNRPRP
jgi:hypothetical protein